jgi:hypothetical protein
MFILSLFQPHSNITISLNEQKFIEILAYM